MLIDYTYFDSALCRVAGINANNHGEITASAFQLRGDIGTMIAELEPRFLQMLLGGNWATLITNSEVVQALVDAEACTSPIAKYVWYYWAKLQATRNTASGEKVKDGEFSSNANIMHRATFVWNTMVDDVINAVAAISNLEGVTIAPDFSAPIFSKRNIFGL